MTIEQIIIPTLFAISIYAIYRIIKPPRKKNYTKVAHNDYKYMVRIILKTNTIEELRLYRRRINNFSKDHSLAIDAKILQEELNSLYDHMYDSFMLDGSFSVG